MTRETEGWAVVDDSDEIVGVGVSKLNAMREAAIGYFTEGYRCIRVRIVPLETD